jgi:hypothetical protein
MRDGMPGFEQLQEYKIVHGHCLVPNKYECAEGAKLGKMGDLAARSMGTTDIENKPNAAGKPWTPLALSGRCGNRPTRWTTPVE